MNPALTGNGYPGLSNYPGIQAAYQKALRHVRSGIALMPVYCVENLTGFGKQIGMIFPAELELLQGNARNATEALGIKPAAARGVQRPRF